MRVSEQELVVVGEGRIALTLYISPRVSTYN